jgi:hypothetical protein
LLGLSDLGRHSEQSIRCGALADESLQRVDLSQITVEPDGPMKTPRDRDVFA